MALHLVSYHVRAPGRDYERLIARLIELGGLRALECLWLVPSSAKPSELRDELKPLLDPNDGLLVIRVRRKAAWWRLELRRPQMRAMLRQASVS
jgi:hypothetical protein